MAKRTTPTTKKPPEQPISRGAKACKKWIPKPIKEKED